MAFRRRAESFASQRRHSGIATDYGKQHAAACRCMIDNRLGGWFTLLGRRRKRSYELAVHSNWSVEACGTSTVEEMGSKQQSLSQEWLEEEAQTCVENVKFAAH
jgi:hypothetical protein